MLRVRSSGRTRRKLGRSRRTRDSKCTHILLDRTSNPFPPFSSTPKRIVSSLSFSLSRLPHTSLYLYLSICLSSIFHVYSVTLFQFPGFASKGAFVAALLFANLRRVYTSGFTLERSSPSYVLLYIYIRYYTRIELSIYLSICSVVIYIHITTAIRIYIYIYTYLSLCLSLSISLCMALSHVRQVTEPQSKIGQ